MTTAVATNKAWRYFGSLRIIPKGCSLGSFPGPEPFRREALPIDLPDSQLNSCSGHRVLSSRWIEATALTTSAGTVQGTTPLTNMSIPQPIQQGNPAQDVSQTSVKSPRPATISRQFWSFFEYTQFQSCCQSQPYQASSNDF